MRSLSIGATGMLAQQMNVEVISNNIANMNTTGYKRGRTEFHDLLYQDLRRVGSASSDAGTIVPSGVQVGLGVKAAAVYRITEQGNISVTDNTFDLAVNGKGYFQIELPSGETGYSRAGSFQLSPDGDLVTPDGYLVQPGITIPTKRQRRDRERQRRGLGRHRGSGGADQRRPARTGDLRQRGPAWRRSATTSSRRPGRPAPPTWPRPAPPATAPSCRARWRPPTSTSCRRSPT